MIGSTLIAVGELLVEFVSHNTGCALKELSEFSGPYPSGAPAICIDQAARLGTKTAIFGGIGADNFGKALIERLQSNGVDTNGVQITHDKTTGVAFVSYFKDGSRTFIFHLDNTATDTLDLSTTDIGDRSTILHISGASLGNAKMRAAIEKAVDSVLANGGKISCDPNARKELMGEESARTALLNIMQKSSYLFPSTSDLDVLFPDLNEADAIEKMRRFNPDVLALKRGEEGCTLYSDQAPVTLTGHRVVETDPTGAGDCFCGTFLAMLAQGADLSTAGIYANAAGALSVTRRGPMEGNSSLEEIKQFIAIH